MERDSRNGFDMAEYKNELDSICAGVMPNNWQGHARIAIRESEEVPEQVEETAIAKASKLADKKDKSPERAANDLIRAIAKKRNE